MREFKKVLRRSVIDVVCDVCHHSCLKETICDAEEDLRMFEYATLSADWGYWSDGKDGEKHECHLCEKCYELVKEYIEKQLKGNIEINRLY